MCDYSLDYVASRPAKVGDRLVSTRFRNSITRGFAAIGEPDVAVCLLPGTELAFENEVEYEPALDFFLRNGKVRQKVARFRKLNNEQPHAHHDALEFPDGQIVLLTRLCEGQHATVLQLPAFPRTRSQAERRASRALSSPDGVASCQNLDMTAIEKSHRDPTSCAYAVGYRHCPPEWQAPEGSGRHRWR